MAVAGVEAQASTPAADDAAPAGYGEAIHEAVGHYSAGRWRQAQQAFAQAHALQPSARTFRGLGLSAFYIGEFAAARAAFEQALADTRKPLSDDQRRELAELLLECMRATGRIELQVTPPSARLELDGVATENRVLFLDRGEHALSVSAEGYVPQRTTLAITGGEQRTLELALTARNDEAAAPLALAPPPADAPAPAPAAADHASADPGRDGAARSGGRVLTWIAAAAVPVFAGAAAAVWFTGKAERDAIERACARDLCDPAEAKRRLDDRGVDAHETWTNVSLAASGVALVAATVLFFVEGQHGSRSEIELTAEGAGAAFQARF